MANLTHYVRVDTREHCLADFSRSFGRYRPLQPVPDWWRHFEEWWETCKDDAVYLRTEDRGYSEHVEEPWQF